MKLSYKNAEGYADPTAYKAIANMQKGYKKMGDLNIYRGDVFFVENYGKRIGSEQAEGRPAVIVSNDKNNENIPCVEIVYLTTQPKTSLPTHCKVKALVQSTALCEQITTVSKERLGAFIRQCTDEEMAEIDKAIAVSVGISHANDSTTVDLEEVVKALMSENYELQDRVKDLEETNEKQKTYIADMVQNAGSQDQNDITDLIRIKAERDIYADMYYKILDRVTVR